MFSINSSPKYQYYRINAYMCVQGVLSSTAGVEERYKIRDVKRLQDLFIFYIDIPVVNLLTIIYTLLYT